MASGRRVKQRRKEAREAAKRERDRLGVPCGEPNRNPCSTHQVFPFKIGESEIRRIERIFKEVIGEAGYVANEILAPPHTFETPETVGSRLLKESLAQIGESLNQIDRVNCSVLVAIDAELPWARFVGLRNRLSHAGLRSVIDPKVMLEHVSDFLQLAKRVVYVKCNIQRSPMDTIDLSLTNEDHLVLRSHQARDSESWLVFVTFDHNGLAMPVGLRLMDDRQMRDFRSSLNAPSN